MCVGVLWSSIGQAGQAIIRAIKSATAQSFSIRYSEKNVYKVLQR